MAPNNREFVVALVDEIPPGGRKIVSVKGRSIGVFNLNGEYFAVSNVCPHAGGALCEGTLSGFVQSDGPGHYDYIRRGEVLRCPWHQWEFDIRTGRSWIDPGKIKVRSYDARAVDGEELLGGALGGDEDLRAAGLQPGPYVVDTFEVRAAERYVVLTL
jgi:nitrite reductase/ring-hydroxylating ferredoxin subunit